MGSRTWISTTLYSKRYLAVAWKHRAELQDYERRGFGQFVYLTLCAHVEGILADLVRKRIRSIRHMVRWESLPPMNFKLGEQKHLCDIKPLYESVFRIVDSIADQSHTAPLTKLVELHNVLFSPPLRDVIGKDLHEDLLALASLRNIFAHGRELFLEFDNSFGESATATLDTNPIQRPALRLHRAGIIKDLQITGLNHDEFHSAFHSDGALLYFYTVVRQIEQKLIQNVTFLPEQQMWTVDPLPDLTA